MSAPAKRDPAIFDYLIRALMDANPVVRQAAIDAALVAFWADLRGPLERVADEDAEAELREFAKEILETLDNPVWKAASEAAFNFEPLPPDPRRITGLSGLGAEWYEAVVGKKDSPGIEVPQAVKDVLGISDDAYDRVVGKRPVQQVEVGNSTGAFQLPAWLAALMQQGDWASIHWHTIEQIQAAASQTSALTPDPQMAISPTHLKKVRALWESMVPVAERKTSINAVGWRRLLPSLRGRFRGRSFELLLNVWEDNE